MSDLQVNQQPDNRRGIRLLFLGLAFGALGLMLVGWLTLGEQADYYITPSTLQAKQLSIGTGVRVGGLVSEQSLQQTQDSTDATATSWHFLIEDGQAQLQISYVGTLPTLFREGQGVIIDGKLAADGRIIAHRLLAQHDQFYRPPGVN